MGGTTLTLKKTPVRKLTGKAIAANAASPNHCYYDGASNIFNLREITQRFCNECGAAGKLTMRPAAVLKYCNVHGTELVDVRQVCSERHNFMNRLKRFLLIGYGHMDSSAVTIHKDLVSTIKFERVK